MAKAGSNASINTSGSTLYDRSTDGRCTAITVKCLSTSSNNLEVYVLPLHSSTERMTLEPGDSHTFRSGRGGQGEITALVAQASSGTAAATWGIAAIFE